VATGVVISLPWPRSTSVERTRTAIPNYKTINQGILRIRLHRNFITDYVPTEHWQNTSYVFLVNYITYIFNKSALYLTYLDNLNILYEILA